MSAVTAQQKEVARYVASAFGVEKSPISRFWDDDKRSDVYILETANCPRDGVKAYATVGLSDHPLMFKGKEFGARVELVGACEAAFPGFNNVLATLAFCVINSRWFCAPGIIFPDVVAMYSLSSTMSDIYFTHPFIWDDRLKSTQIGDVRVAWLLAVPVSKEESVFAVKNGPGKLEALFMERDIDIYDMNRPSVV